MTTQPITPAASPQQTAAAEPHTWPLAYTTVALGTLLTGCGAAMFVRSLGVDLDLTLVAIVLLTVTGLLLLVAGAMRSRSTAPGTTPSTDERAAPTPMDTAPVSDPSPAGVGADEAARTEPRFVESPLTEPILAEPTPHDHGTDEPGVADTQRM